MKQPSTYVPSTLHWRLTRAIRPELSFDIAEGARDVAAWQRRLRKKLRELLGLNRMPPVDRPLRVRTLWTRENELGTIEKLVFEAEPGADAPAYLCTPKKPRGGGKPPVFICLQGHSSGMHRSIGVTQDESGPMEIAGDRDFGLGCLRRGIAALCIEQRAFGERVEPDPKRPDLRINCDDAVKHALMLGRTLVGERVYDVARGIELLKQRGGFDLSQLGLMGQSGGGTATIYGAAVLPELRLAMPSCSFCTHAASIMSIYHCSDNYVPGLLCYAESADVLGLFAPRPVVIVAGKTDDIFPVAAVRKAFGDLKRIYAAAGAADRCKLVIGGEGHRFYAEAGWKAMLGMMR